MLDAPEQLEAMEEDCPSDTTESDDELKAAKYRIAAEKGLVEVGGPGPHRARHGQARQRELLAWLTGCSSPLACSCDQVLRHEHLAQGLRWKPRRFWRPAPPAAPVDADGDVGSDDGHRSEARLPPEELDVSGCGDIEGLVDTDNETGGGKDDGEISGSTTESDGMGSGDDEQGRRASRQARRRSDTSAASNHGAMPKNKQQKALPIDREIIDICSSDDDDRRTTGPEAGKMRWEVQKRPCFGSVACLQARPPSQPCL